MNRVRNSLLIAYPASASNCISMFSWYWCGNIFLFYSRHSRCVLNHFRHLAPCAFTLLIAILTVFQTAPFVSSCSCCSYEHISLPRINTSTPRKGRMPFPHIPLSDHRLLLRFARRSRKFAIARTRNTRAACLPSAAVCPPPLRSAAPWPCRWLPTPPTVSPPLHVACVMRLAFTSCFRGSANCHDTIETKWVPLSQPTGSRQPRP